MFSCRGKRGSMTSQVVQRFRECQNLLDSIVSSLHAICNLTSQRIVVEEAMRRIGPSFFSGSDENMNSMTVALRCCADPLGVLLAFPESALELIIAQHAEDVNTLLRSLNTSQQAWNTKLQQAKEASQSEVKQEFMVGVHALLAVLAHMYGWLRELLFALRADLANPPKAVKLSQCLNAYSSCVDGAIPCIVAIPLERALEQLAERVQREWEICKARHMVDESWILLAS